MQVLKEEIRCNILKAAVMEFKEKGFKNSSLRKIAELSGVTVGNLYRYFKDKQDLFSCIVNPPYEKIMGTIKKSMELKEVSPNIVLIDHMTESIIESHISDMDSLLILFNGSKGTRYENVKLEIVSLLENSIIELSKKRFSEQRDCIEDYFLLHVITIDFIEGMLLILNHYRDVEKVKKAIAQFIRFYFKGEPKIG